MQKKANKGGAPNKKTRVLHEKLEDLGLFDRKGKVYMTIEQELESLTPARAFDLFTHYCARRAKFELAYENAANSSKDRLRHTIQLRIIMLDLIDRVDPDLKILLDKLHHYDEALFVRYMDIHAYDYALSKNPNIESTNNFAFEITATFSWNFIAHFYSEEQQAKIKETIFEEHLFQSSELQHIYKTSKDKESIKKYHAFLLMGNQRVSIEDVTTHIRSIYYLKDRALLEHALYKDRYRDIKYQVKEVLPKNSAMPSSYQPNVLLSLNMNKPIDYIQELLSTLKIHWREINDNLGSESSKYKISEIEEVRSKIMKFQKNKRTLAGKLVDILYVYDCKQFGLTNPFIIKNLTSRWHQNKRGHQETVSLSTINIYHKLGMHLINQKYYKEY